MENINRKKILFIPGIVYLANPHFFSITKYLKHFQLIYLYTKDSYGYLMKIYDEKVDVDEINRYFDLYDEVEDFEGYDELSDINRIKRYKRYYNYIKGVKSKLDYYKPNCIISGSDKYLSQRIAIQWAKKRKVPYIILQVAFLEKTRPVFSLRSEIRRYIFNNILSMPIYRKRTLIGEENKETYLFLWGEQFKKLYNKKRAYVLGNPLFDKLLRDSVFNSKLKNIENLQSTKTVLICSDGNICLISKVGDKIVSKTMKLWYETIKNNSDLKFIIKPHPGEKRKEFDEYFGKLQNAKIIADKNLYDLFKTSDVQISVNSASSFEAVFAGLPIILTNLDKSEKLPDFFNNEIELRATTEQQLTNMIRKSLTPEYLSEFKTKREQFIKKRLFSFDGKSAERVARKIEEIMLNHYTN